MFYLTVDTTVLSTLEKQAVLVPNTRHGKLTHKMFAVQQVSLKSQITDIMHQKRRLTYYLDIIPSNIDFDNFKVTCRGSFG